MSRWFLPGVLLLMASTGPASAQSAGVYKWVDEAGMVHFDDRGSVRGRRLTRDFLNDRVIPPASGAQDPVPIEWREWVARECDVRRGRLHALTQAQEVYGITPFGHEYRYSDQQVRLLQRETEIEARHLCAPDAPRRAWLASLEAPDQAETE